MLGAMVALSQFQEQRALERHTDWYYSADRLVDGGPREGALSGEEAD